MPITKLVINRQLWGAGALLNPDGTMCCLGFASLACGVPLNHLTTPYDGTIGYPSNDWVNVNEWMRNTDGDVPWASVSNPPAAAKSATSINDGDDILSVKEEKLIKLFADNGVELSFTGEPRV